MGTRISIDILDSVEAKKNKAEPTSGLARSSLDISAATLALAAMLGLHDQ